MSRATIEMILRIHEACATPLYSVLEGIKENELNWQPASESRSIGSIINHLIRVDKGFLKKLGYNTKTNDIEGGSAKEILSALKSHHKEVRDIIISCKDDSELYEKHLPDKKERGTLGDIIVHISQHYMYHLSQVIYLRRAQNRQWKSPEGQWEEATYIIAELLEPVRRIHKIEKVM
ncbi:MAG: DinB family protein [Bacillota bacterium]